MSSAFYKNGSQLIQSRSDLGRGVRVAKTKEKSIELPGLYPVHINCISESADEINCAPFEMTLDSIPASRDYDVDASVLTVQACRINDQTSRESMFRNCRGALVSSLQVRCRECIVSPDFSQVRQSRKCPINLHFLLDLPKDSGDDFPSNVCG